MSVYLTVLVTALITSIVSSVIGAIVGNIVGRLNARKQASSEAVSEAVREAEEVKQLLEQLTMMTCRLAIYNDHFSTNEKLEAYEVYRDHGWNHDTKKYMDVLLGMDADEYLERHRRKEH